MSRCRYWLGIFLGLGFVGGAYAAGPAPSQVAEIELSKPFDAVSPWRFVVTQDPEKPNPDVPNDPDSKIPGLIHLCLQKGAAAPCDADLVAMPKPPASLPADIWEPHYLNQARIVYQKGKAEAPLLLMQTASAHSGDGDQAVFTQLLAYDRAKDRFASVYAFETGRNNNQEVRFIEAGPLQGRVISAEPTSDAPFGYWITVNAMAPDARYKQILRYRSATRYGDGNPLAVIDAEMPNIQQRLGVWRPGQPLPLPADPCPKPRLSHTVLWCS